MKILYVKNNSERAKKFQLKTIIYEENGQKYVKKQASCREAIPHLKKMKENYYKLTDSIIDPKIKLAKIIDEAEDSLTFEFIEGVSLEEKFTEALSLGSVEIDKFIHEYKQVIGKGFKTKIFNSSTMVTKNYTKFFGDLDYRKLDGTVCFDGISNLDLVFTNIIYKNDDIYIIDYEWVFEVSVPMDYIFYRVLGSKKELKNKKYLEIEKHDLFHLQESFFLQTHVIPFNSFFNIRNAFMKKRIDIDTDLRILHNTVTKKDNQIIELHELLHTQQTNNAVLVEELQAAKIEKHNLWMETRSEIDISIVTYNSQKWLDAFFKSLDNQAYPMNRINLYITDNSSTDDTYLSLENLQQKYINTFASFNLRKEKNLGFGYGHNNNFKYAKSNFILVTNVDLEFEENAIVNVVEYALKDKNEVASWEFRQKPFEHPKYYNPVTLETNWSSSACILFRKEAIDKIGGYDDHIFMYGEDVELSYRLRDHGYVLKYYPKAVCWHYTYAEANEVKELQYFGSTLANILIRMRYGRKEDIKEGLKLYRGLLNTQGLFWNQRRKQLKYLLRLILKSPYFLLNRKKNKNNTYKFLNWDYEFIRDGAFYEYVNHRPAEYPLVSVVMRTCCERNGFLRESIESVKNQTYPNIELVVIEDGTTNAKNLVQNVHNDNISNIIYKSIEKAGRCHAGNVGLEMTSGEYVIFLDDDDLFFADHLEVLVQEIMDNPTVSACYSSAFEVSTNIISLEPLHYEEESFSVFHREEFSRETMLHHNFIPIQSILFKRALYEEYGGFDEELDNLEDWNLWTRYSYLNDFKFIDKTTSLYRVPSCSNISQSRQDELDRYYKIAVEKQKEFIQNLSSD